jgi:hypothetical protein
MNEIIEYVAARFQAENVPLILYPAKIDSLYTKPTKMDGYAYMLLNEGVLDEVLSIDVDIREFSEWLTMKIYAELFYFDQPQEVIDSEFDKLIDEDQRNAANSIPTLKHYLPRS